MKDLTELALTAAIGVIVPPGAGRKDRQCPAAAGEPEAAGATAAAAEDGQDEGALGSDPPGDESP